MKDQAVAQQLSDQGRNEDRKKLSQKESELETLKNKLIKKETEFERSSSASHKKTEKISAELAESKASAIQKSDEIEALTSDYGTAMTDLDTARNENSRIKKERVKL